MCTRYTLHKPEAALRAVAQSLGVTLEFAAPFLPRFNLAPSAILPVVTWQAGSPRLQRFRWGLLPPADRGQTAPRHLANARAETVTKLPAFRAAAAERRCLVPANGFYEFKNLGRRKEPYVFMRPEEAHFAFAGLWEPPEGESPGTCCILTTEPNAMMVPIHNRMPMVLTGAAMGRWLGEQPLALAAWEEFTRPVAVDLLVPRRVDSYVNNSHHEGPQCLAEAAAELPELGLIF
jgi:putative SOS response-associated peptidase YedK